MLRNSTSSKLRRTVGIFVAAVVAAHTALAQDADLEICLEGKGSLSALGLACERALSLPTTRGATRATLLVRRAGLFAAEGNVDDALADLAAAVAANPYSAAAHNLRGLLRHRRGDIDGALSDFASAASLNPHDGEPHGHWAALLLQLKRSEEAIAHAEKALSLAPGHALASLVLGAKAFGDEDFQKAAQHFRSVLEGPRLNYPLAAFWYAAAVARQGGDAAEAFAPYRWWWDVGGWPEAMAGLFDGELEAAAVEKAIPPGARSGRTQALFFLSQWRHANGAPQAAHKTLEEALIGAPPYLLEAIVAKRMLGRVAN